MAKKSHKRVLLERRRGSVRKKIAGTTAQPRLSVFRSARHIYAQIIDDTGGRTLASASSVALKVTGGTVDAAQQVGQALGEQAKARGIEQVRFDRGGRLYHGRVKALADGARKAGLKF